jgi:hypothetical protein
VDLKTEYSGRGSIHYFVLATVKCELVAVIGNQQHLPKMGMDVPQTGDADTV